MTYYSESQWRLFSESSRIERGFDNQIFLVFLGEAEYIDGGLGVAQFLCGPAPKELTYCNNLVVIPTIRRHIIRALIAHELGHAFGLEHTSHQLWIKNRIDVNRINLMHHPLGVIKGKTMILKQHFALSRNDATFLNKGGRLSVQKESDIEIALDTGDVDIVGYNDDWEYLLKVFYIVLRSKTGEKTGYFSIASSFSMHMPRLVFKESYPNVTAVYPTPPRAGYWPRDKLQEWCIIEVGDINDRHLEAHRSILPGRDTKQ